MLLCLQSCQQKKEITVLYEKSFDEVKALANEKGKPFCIVFVRDKCPPCEIFLNTLYSTKNTKIQELIYNVVDISQPQNVWYTQWVGITASPTSCIFSKEGDFQAVVVGTNQRMLDCLGKVIEGDVSCAQYMYDGQAKAVGKANLFQALNNILKSKEKLEKGIDISEDVSNYIEQIHYPYSLYLAAKNELNKGNKEDAKNFSEQLLTFQYDIENLRLYTPFFKEAHYIIDPHYNPDNEAQLSVDNEINMDNYTAGEIKEIKIKLTNTGKKKLLVKDILLSCSCLTMKGKRNLEIEVGGSKEIVLEFLSQDQGKIVRKVEIISNSSISPAEQITITVNSKSI